MKLGINPPNINSPETGAFFTTRVPGSNSDKLSAVSRQTGIALNRMYLPVQRHTDTIQVLDDDMNRIIADGVITSRKGILIGVLVADCVPVLLYDGRRKVIGAVHAGWRGTASGILKNAVHTMQERFQSCSEDISVAIGPSIGRCSYEVGEEVIEAVQSATGEGDYYSRLNGKYYLDIAAANRIQAMQTGALSENIWQSGECTFCNPDRFYSYRYAGECSGRQGGFVIMW